MVQGGSYYAMKYADPVLLVSDSELPIQFPGKILLLLSTPHRDVCEGVCAGQSTDGWVWARGRQGDDLPVFSLKCWIRIK